MFEDIAEMEREIETFRKNVVASSDLVEGISELTAETKKQKESFSASTEELLKKLDTCIAQFKSDHESALHSLSDSNDAAIETLQKNMSVEQQIRIAELEKILTEFNANQAQVTKKAEDQQKAFTEKLQEAETVIRDYQSTAENKYAEFVNQLKNTNVDQIFKEVQELKKSIQTKFVIMMGGIGITLIVAIAGLLLK